MRNIVSYFIKYPVTGNILIILILFLGFFGFKSINYTLMPQVDPGMIVVTAAYPGSSPQEIEEGIILKIEDNLKGLSGIEKTTSTSKENYGMVNVKLVDGYNPDVVLQDVKNAVDGINSFPAGMEPPNIRKVEFLTPAVFMSISGDVDLKTLKTYARQVEDELREIDGISKVTLSGYPDEEIEISFREDDLKAFGISFTEAYNAVKTANIDLTGGTIRGKDEQLFVRTKQKKYYADELLNIVLRTSEDGGMVRLGEVADVKDRWNENPNYSYLDGKQAVQINISQTSREDIIHISKEIEKYAKEFNEKTDVVKLNINYDVSTEIESMLDILVNNGVVGFLLVLFFLSLFLNHRLSFWVAFSLPLSFMGMFILASMYGITLNRISLFGMILVIGILVDDGIVIAENIYQHFEKGKSAIRAAIDGTIEVFPAVFSAVLTTIVAFSAFFFIDGMFGQFMIEMAFVVIGALIFSLIEGALILPGHIAHSKALKKGRKKNKIESIVNGSLIKFRDKIYAPFLDWSLRNKLTTVAIPVTLLMITVGAYIGGIIQTGDSSIKDQNYTNVTLEMPAGTPDAVTLSYLAKIEDAVVEVAKKFDDKRTDGKHVVEGIQTDLTASNYGKMTIMLLKGQDRDFHTMEFSNAIRNRVGGIPEAERLNFVQESHFGKPVSLSFKSYDLETLNAVKEEIKEELNSLSGLKNVIDNHETGMREIKITLKDKAYILGLNLQDVMSQVRYGFFGMEVQRINRGLDLVKVWVRYNEEDRVSIGNLENMRIRTQDGKSIPLIDIANLSYERNLVSINHLNGRREVTIQADVVDETVNLSEIRSEINGVIIPQILSKYPGVTTYQGGKEEEMKKASGSVAIIIPVILIILLAVITFTFRSFSQTILVFLLIPFGMIGIGWGHVIHGYSIDMPSYFGIVALVGVMVNDAIVLISRVNILLREGMDYTAAVYKAAVSRFRPIVLTSITTIAGLYPIILSPSSDARMVIPMAISVAYGLIVATFLTLVLLPVLLMVSNQIKVGRKWLWTGVKPSNEEVEQAVIELQTN